jgi:hypothetical protein
MMKRFLHTAGTFFVLFLTVFLIPTGCGERSDVEDTVQREIEAITAMKQLSLVEYRVSKIIKADDEGAWYKIGERKILLSCTAYLKAGIDLATFGPDDVDVDWTGKRVSVTIPHATLLSLDMPASEIRQEYDHVTMLRQSFTAEERNALLRQGEKQIRDSVPSLGILEKADENARRFFESVFQKMGFESVEVAFR